MRYKVTPNGRLVVGLPEAVLSRAFEIDPLLRLRLLGNPKIWALRDSGEPEVTLRTDYIGKIARFNRKVSVAEQAAQDLGTLICRAPTEHNPLLEFEAFFSGESDFAFHVSATLPEDVYSEEASTRAKNGMICVQKALRMWPANDPIYDLTTTAAIDSEQGVSLGTSVHSSIHTMGERYLPGSRRVELFGNNVANFF